MLSSNFECCLQEAATRHDSATAVVDMLSRALDTTPFLSAEITAYVGDSQPRSTTSTTCSPRPGPRSAPTRTASKSTHVTETVYRHVIVPAIRGGATVMDDVFGAEDEESA